MKKKLNYKLGDIFSFPLKTGGYARGVIARMNSKGNVLGYFYGPRFESDEDFKVNDISPASAIIFGKFGDLGLLKNRWKVIGAVENFDAMQWPIQPLGRTDQNAGLAWLSYYDDQLVCIREEIVSPAIAEKYPLDGTFGYLAMEAYVSRLLNKKN